LNPSDLNILKALGIDMSPTLLAHANELIE